MKAEIGSAFMRSTRVRPFFLLRRTTMIRDVYSCTPMYVIAASDRRVCETRVEAVKDVNFLPIHDVVSVDLV